ncbi:hypothetical protein F5X68DRAFT_240037 [Plectosphaerella plurivora]|uniref:Nucleoside phosphorylase domain-containing protein n=1 Tax=Plectosphaerella plurivora TaxID=936078 RepID=A0A9P9AC27_9PEZI|nr:hypothetical protein F5X68DRAFT_240037 [Plectosphaerella plurivora]
MQQLNPADYHVAWIAPPEIEYAAAIQMLDEWHNVATLASEFGNVTAAALTSEIRIRFPKIQLSLLVGIAAGLPLLPDRDIRLGDVLVAVPSQSDTGIVAYDTGKIGPGGYEKLATLAQPAPLVRSVVTAVRGEWRGLHSKPGPGSKAKFQSYYDAIERKGNDTGHELPMTPRIWYGSIGAGEKLFKDVFKAFELRDTYNIIGLETEAYGAATGLGTGVIREVCNNYSNEYDNKMWQPYAAAMAAAYAKTLIVRVGNLNPDPEGPAARLHGQYIAAVFCDRLAALKYLACSETLIVARPGLQLLQTAAQTKQEQRAASTVNFDCATENLVQRKNLYESISKSFDSSNRVVLWGLGGVGKSRAAIEFAYQTAGEDPSRSIYWISAISASRFVDSAREISLQISKETLETVHKLSSPTHRRKVALGW